MPFDRALQVTSSVFGIGALVQQETLYLGGAVEHKLIGCGSHQDALLYHAEFDVEDLLKVLRPQRLEGHNFVDAVHELWRELATGSFDRSAIDFVIKT